MLIGELYKPQFTSMDTMSRFFISGKMLQKVPYATI
jgi:hypothetical protein